MPWYYWGILGVAICILSYLMIWKKLPVKISYAIFTFVFITLLFGQIDPETILEFKALGVQIKNDVERARSIRDEITEMKAQIDSTNNTIRVYVEAIVEYMALANSPGLVRDKETLRKALGDRFNQLLDFVAPTPNEKLLFMAELMESIGANFADESKLIIDSLRGARDTQQ